MWLWLDWTESIHAICSRQLGLSDPILLEPYSQHTPGPVEEPLFPGSCIYSLVLGRYPYQLSDIGFLIVGFFSSVLNVTCHSCHSLKCVSTSTWMILHVYIVFWLDLPETSFFGRTPKTVFLVVIKPYYFTGKVYWKCVVLAFETLSGYMWHNFILFDDVLSLSLFLTIKNGPNPRQWLRYRILYYNLVVLTCMCCNSAFPQPWSFEYLWIENTCFSESESLLAFQPMCSWLASISPWYTVQRGVLGSTHGRCDNCLIILYLTDRWCEG